MTLVPIAGIAVIAAASTLGDFIWYTNGVAHTVIAGVTYGVLVLMSVGAVLGLADGRILRGLPIGFVAGIAGALSYYGFVLTIDRRPYGTAIPAAWVTMWFILSALEGRWLHPDGPRSWTAIAARGALAALLGGIVFAAVREVLWGWPASADRNYLVQFITWAIAWAPGVLTLTWQAGARPGSIAAAELARRLAAGERLPILDVRSEAEYVAGHVPGAVNVPFTQISSRQADVPGGTGGPGGPGGSGGVNVPLIVYCGHGPRAHIAGAALRRLGWRRLLYLSGHFSGWQRAGLPIER